MNLENIVSEMMKINVQSRLWHWATDVAQHHTTYEQFLTQNEQFTDSLVESALGNDKALNFAKVGVTEAFLPSYELAQSRAQLQAYRESIKKYKTELSQRDGSGDDELVTILDDVTELCSKTLYLLSLR